MALRTKTFFDLSLKKIKQDYLPVLNQIREREVQPPDWVLTTVNVLSGDKRGNVDIFAGGYKVAVIDKGRSSVYTFEIVSREKHAQKEETYEMLRTVERNHGKLQLRLPNDTFSKVVKLPLVKLPVDKFPEGSVLVAYFNKTEYCDEVQSLMDRDKTTKCLGLPTETLDDYFLQVMHTYKTLCDEYIYLTDIKPENMILCKDGLYFIDINDVSVVKDERTPRLNMTATEFYSTDDYRKEMRRYKSNFSGKPPEKSDRRLKECLKEVRARLEYEGWQALAKTYLNIKTKLLLAPENYQWYKIHYKVNEDSIAMGLLEVINPDSCHLRNGSIRRLLQFLQQKEADRASKKKRTQTTLRF